MVHGGRWFAGVAACAMMTTFGAAAQTLPDNAPDPSVATVPAAEPAPAQEAPFGPVESAGEDIVVTGSRIAAGSRPCSRSGH